MLAGSFVPSQKARGSFRIYAELPDLPLSHSLAPLSTVIPIVKFLFFFFPPSDLSSFDVRIAGLMIPYTWTKVLPRREMCPDRSCSSSFLYFVLCLIRRWTFRRANSERTVEVIKRGLPLSLFFFIFST